MKRTLSTLFKIGVYQFQNAFDVFTLSFGKVFGYFVVLNLLLFLPISVSLIMMNDIDYDFIGMDFHEEVPEFITDGFPSSCVIVNNILDCGMDTVFTYEIKNNDTIWAIYFNVPNDMDYTVEQSIIFYRTGIHMNFTDGNRFILDYDHFNLTDFNVINQMDDQEAYELLINKMFLTVKDVFLLPAILFVSVAMFATNLILILAISAISMLFKFNQSNFPSYKNIVKLMIMASTIPTFINIFLGFRGLVAFTPIVYNIITPIIAFFMYRASRLKNQLVD